METRLLRPSVRVPRVPVEDALKRIQVTMPNPSTVPWSKVVIDGAPDTPEKSRVWGAEHAFKNVPVVAGKTEVQLIRFGKDQHEYQDLVAYAEANYLTSAHPRHCLEVARQHPDLRSLLKCAGNNFCTIAVPRAFPETDARESNSVFNVLFDQADHRTAQYTAMWRRAYVWEWFAFIPVARHLKPVA